MRFLTLIAVLIVPVTAQAQNNLPQNDLTVSLGWSGAEHDSTNDYDRWRGSLFVGVSGGHYWTEHVKTEIEAAWNSRTTDEVYEELVVGATRTYGIATYRVSDARLSLGQSYQFGRNEWVHPFVGVGADLVRRHVEMDRPAQTRQTYTYQRPIDVRIPAAQSSDTRALVRPYVKGGWKMYASDRLYFTTEFKLGFAPDLDHALWKIGMGFDF